MNLNQSTHDQILKALASTGEFGADASPLIKEDLEIEAQNQLYEQTSPLEMVLLKDLPRIKATNIIHEYDEVQSYGDERNSGVFPENGLPVYSNLVTNRKTVNVKLLGELAAVNLIAQLQDNINALGQSDLVGIEDEAKTRLLMHKANRNLYFMDSAATAHNLRFKGVAQLIRESSPATHVIDLRGQKISPENIRKAATLISENFGGMSGVYLSLKDKENLETQLDSSERLYLNNRDNAGVIMGQNVDGMYTNGGLVYFRPDNTLSPPNANLHLPTSFPEGAPAALATVTATARATAGMEVSQWAASDAAADIAYYVTAVNGSDLEGEVLAVTPVSVSAGQVVELSITPRATDKSFRIYRGSTTLGITPSFIKELPHTAGDTTPFTWVDENNIMPGTRTAFGLSVYSRNFRAGSQNYEMKNIPMARNTIAIAELIPMSVFGELAKLGLLASNNVIFWPLAAEMTHPKQNVMWINCGDN